MMSILPETLLGKRVYVPTFAITCAGVPLPLNEAKHVTSLSVESSLNMPSTFTINLNNQGLLFLKDRKDLFAEGTLVAIAIGYLGASLSPMIVGDVERLDADFPADGAPTLTVTGFDLMHRLTRSTHPQTAEQASAADLTQRTVQGLQVEIDPRIPTATGATLEYIAQTLQHDLAFLTDWARKLGWVLKMEGQTLHIAPGEAPLKEALVLHWGRELISFSSSASIAHLVKNLEVRGRNPKRNEDYVGRASLRPQDIARLPPAARAAIEGTRHVSDQRQFASQAEADTAASTLLRSLADRTTTANGTCVGIPELRAGMKVTLEGVGRFDGTYQVLTVTHTLGSNGYQTSFTVGMGAEAGADEGAGETTEGRFPGVVVGIVTNNNDQDQLGRVKVRFPNLPNQVQSNWARVASPMAGTQRGVQFLPEVNDEVLVAFEWGDFHRPYVLGGLWNDGARPPESSPLDNQAEKVVRRVIKSRAGHLIRLDDTDNAEKIEIIDKTGNNSIAVDSANNTITIHSARDIVLDAPNGKVTIKAANLEATADQRGVIEGRQGLDLKASGGNVNVNGTMVNINS